MDTLRGIITVLNTPFTETDVLDLVSLRKNVACALEAGAAGFLVPAMASEVGKLSTAERCAMLEIVVDEVAGRVPVIGGASADSSDERRVRAGEALAIGCDGVLVSVGYQNVDQYRREVYDIAELNPPFLMIQDWDFHGYGAPVPLIARLFEEVGCFKCLKVEVVPAGVKYSEVLEATGGRLHVSGGWAVMQMIEALDRGVHAFMPTGMHGIYVEIYRRYHDVSRDSARALFNELLPVLAFSNQHLDMSIHFFKRLLHQQGIYATPRVREPILPFDSNHERIAAELIERVMELASRVAKERV